MNFSSRLAFLLFLWQYNRLDVDSKNTKRFFQFTLIQVKERNKRDNEKLNLYFSYDSMGEAKVFQDITNPSFFLKKNKFRFTFISSPNSNDIIDLHLEDTYRKTKLITIIKLDRINLDDKFILPLCYTKIPIQIRFRILNVNSWFAQYYILTTKFHVIFRNSQTNYDRIELRDLILESPKLTGFIVTNLKNLTVTNTIGAEIFNSFSHLLNINYKNINPIILFNHTRENSKKKLNKYPFIKNLLNENILRGKYLKTRLIDNNLLIYINIHYENYSRNTAKYRKKCVSENNSTKCDIYGNKICRDPRTNIKKNCNQNKSNINNKINDTIKLTINPKNFFTSFTCPEGYKRRINKKEGLITKRYFCVKCMNPRSTNYCYFEKQPKYMYCQINGSLILQESIKNCKCANEFGGRRCEINCKDICTCNTCYYDNKNVICNKTFCHNKGTIKKFKICCSNSFCK